MEPVALATLAFRFLKPLIKAGSEEFAKDSGKDLWSFVKTLFTKHYKEESLSKMNEDTSKDLAEILKKEPEAKKYVEEQVKHLVEIGVYQQITGDGNIVLGSITGSSITINR